jgi:hypothetical protein
MLPVGTPVFCIYDKIEYMAQWCDNTVTDASGEKRSLSGWVRNIALGFGKNRQYDGWNKCFIKTESGERRSLFKVREAALAPAEDPEDPKITEISEMLLEINAKLLDLDAKLLSLAATGTAVAATVVAATGTAVAATVAATETAVAATVAATETAVAATVAATETVIPVPHAYVNIVQVSESASIEDLTDAYTFNTGLKSCYCKHCHKEQPLARFSITLRKQAKKGILGKNPLKTCDDMMELNARANPYANAVGNAKTSIKTWTKKRHLASSEEEVCSANTKIAHYTANLAAAMASRAQWDADNK